MINTFRGPNWSAVEFKLLPLLGWLNALAFGAVPCTLSYADRLMLVKKILRFSRICRGKGHI